MHQRGPPEQQRVGRLGLLAESRVEVGLIDLLIARDREPAFARVDVTPARVTRRRTGRY
ncbi:MAG TPA: hypothetical protein VHH57_09145 [Gaiella sp.]|nr:hypothetical protein [Gaiella sp.]